MSDYGLLSCVTTLVTLYEFGVMANRVCEGIYGGWFLR